MTNTNTSARTATSTAAQIPVSEKHAKSLFWVSITCLVVAAVSIAVRALTGHGQVPTPLIIMGAITWFLAMTSSTTYGSMRQRRLKKQR